MLLMLLLLLLLLRKYEWYIWHQVKAGVPVNLPIKSELITIQFNSNRGPPPSQFKSNQVFGRVELN